MNAPSPTTIVFYDGVCGLCNRLNRFLLGAFYRRYRLGPERRVSGEIAVNPLYRIEKRGPSSILTLEFPTPEYEAEFGDCRRYLPERLTVEADLTGRITADSLGPLYDELLERRVLIDAPVGYAATGSSAGRSS